MTETAKWLAGGVAFATAVFAFLGATGGEVERLLRNHEGEFVFALVLVVVAASLGALLPAMEPILPLGVRLALLGIGIVVLVFGVIRLADLAAESSSENERPEIAATYEEGEKAGLLNATINANGLKSSEHLAVTVYATSRQGGKHPLLYGARTGPNADGDVKHTLKLPIALRKYEAIDVYADLQVDDDRLRQSRQGCDKESQTIACATVYPQRAEAAVRSGRDRSDRARSRRGRRQR